MNFCAACQNSGWVFVDERYVLNFPESKRAAALNSVFRCECGRKGSTYEPPRPVTKREEAIFRGNLKKLRTMLHGLTKADWKNPRHLGETWQECPVCSTEYGKPKKLIE